MRQLWFGIAVILLAACDDILSPSANIDVTTKVSSKVILPAEATTVTVVARNTGSEPVSVTVPCQAPYEIQRSDGTVVEQVLHGCLAHIDVRQILPGDSLTLGGVWKADQRPPVGAPDRDALDASRPVPAGTYYIRGNVQGAYSIPIEVQVK